MAKWITNWPNREKWGTCSAAMAAQVSAEGRCQVMLIEALDRIPLVRRHILQTPDFARTLAQRAPAVAVAKKYALR